MFIYKKLKASDANTIAFEAHKEWNINKDNTSSLGITLIDSSYTSASRDTYSAFDINNHKQYFQLDHLFYKDALFNYGNLIGGIDYNNQEKRLYDKATIISLSQKTFGSSVQKGTFLFNGNYKDDSKGNLYSQNETLTNYPLDKERTFYLAPVKGFKYVDLTRDPKTGEPIVNPPSTYNNLKLDDSLYINPIEYISCSLVRNTTLNCSAVDLTNGYIKAPNSNNYNFGDEDFTITFYYKTTTKSTPKYILAKSKTQTVVGYPESNLNSSLKNTHGSASLLQPKEVDAGKAFPFEVVVTNNQLEFRRSDQDVSSFITCSTSNLADNTLVHVGCVKSGNDLKIYINGAQDGANQTDNTTSCRNKADLFIGTDPTISSSKLNNTEAQEISQLMIWNKALSTTEIANVSESIIGSPYVGSIFYENGIATLTSPKVNDGTLTSLTHAVSAIRLGSSGYEQAEGSDEETIEQTFSGSLTFTSSREEFTTNLSGSEIYPDLIYSSTHLSASLSGDTISLSSKPEAFLDVYTINPIASSSYSHSFDSSTELNTIVNAIPGGPGTGSGETGTDADSITVRNAPNSFYVGLSLDENQTFTQSINILHISNSQTLISENFTGSDTTIPGGFEIPSNPTFGCEYIDTLYNGLYVKATEPNTNAHYTGSLKHSGSTVFPSTNEFKPLAYNTVEYDLPVGAVQGATYKLLDGTHLHNVGVIQIDETVPLTGGQGAIFRYNVLISGFSPSVFGTYSLKVRLWSGPHDNGGVEELYGTDTTEGSAVWDSHGVSGAFTVPNIPNSPTPQENIVYWLTLELDGSDLDGNQTYQINQFSITYPGTEDTFANQLRVQSPLIITEPDSLYDISLNNIAPSSSLPSPDNNLIWLNQDTLDEDLGVKVLLWSYYGGDYYLITQSFYVSGSPASSNTFSHIYQSSGDNDEKLKIDIIADVASNTIPPQISSLGNLQYSEVPISSSFGIATSTIGASTGLYSVEEISGSNVVQISSDLTSSFTDVSNLTSTILFNDTSDFITLPAPTGPVDILGFVGADQTKVIIDGTYLVTSSFSDTASLERGNYISGSASIDIADSKGLYIVDDITLRTNNSFSTPSGIPDTQKVRIQTKTNGTVVDTRYVDGDLNNQNAFQAESNKLHLGVLDNTDNVSFEFTVVDSSNNIDEVTKDQGFSIDVITLKQITSSNKVTRVDNFPFLSNLDTLYFRSSHINTGSPTFPFNIGIITASIASISTDNKTITLDNNFLVTSSLTDPLYHASGSETGPFIISASYRPNGVAGLSMGKLYKLSQSISNTNVNDPGTGVGFGTKARASSNINDNFENGNGTNTGIFEFKTTIVDLAYPLTYDFFVSGVASTLYHDGTVTASLNYTQSFTPNIQLTAISGSAISSGPSFTLDEYQPFSASGYSSHRLTISSSHINAGGPHSPAFTIGELDVGINSRTSDGHIVINQTLFITASSPATASSWSSSFNSGDYTFLQANPISANGVNSEMLGGTFYFTDLGNGITSNYQITNIIDDPNSSSPDDFLITLDNLDGGSDEIQTIDENELTKGPEVDVSHFTIVPNEFTIQYKNSHLIFENEYHCTVDEDEYNFTMNPTARKLKDIDRGELANFATGSNFKPYVTTVGLYNEEGELLVVGKLGQPIRMSDETDTTFVLRYDT